MRQLAGILPLAIVLSSSSVALALEQTQHRSISRSSCNAVGLPEDFCERVGVEAYNTDAYEWNDLSAHAQIDTGQTACVAANAARDRVQWLGADVRDNLAELAWASSEAVAEHLAVQLGRALHTIQDNCAHHGMPNPQHAWDSLSDSCRSTLISPDIQMSALTCARTETDKVFRALVRQMNTAGVSSSQLDDVDTGWSHYPSRADVCEFLSTASSWNGRDGTWRNEVIVPKLGDQLAYAFAHGDVSIGDVCAGGVSLTPQVLAAPVNTSRGQSRCLKIRTYCLGKADEGGEQAPPWDDGSTADEADTGGCSAGGDAGGGGLTLVLIGLCALRARRR